MGDENQEQKKITRRKILMAIAAVPVASLGLRALQGCGEAKASCYKGEDSGLRKSLGYTEQSPHSEKVCSGCTHFSLQAGSSCGTCQIFNGPANPGGYCSAWGARNSE